MMLTAGGMDRLDHYGSTNADCGQAFALTVDCHSRDFYTDNRK
jgi:hypothetical protein